MRNLFAFFIATALLVMSGCIQKADTEAERVKVKTVVDQFAQSIEKEDMELFSKTMAHDTDMVNFGTDTDERWVGWEALKEAIEKQFASFENTRLTVKDQVIKVDPAGNVAWFSEVTDWDLEAEGRPTHIEGSRITGVLEKRNGNWVCVQFHTSVPASAQAAPY